LRNDYNTVVYGTIGTEECVLYYVKMFFVIVTLGSISVEEDEEGVLLRFVVILGNIDSLGKRRILLAVAEDIVKMISSLSVIQIYQRIKL